MGASRKLAELFYDLRMRTEGLQKDADQAERHLGRFTDFVLRNPITALGALGTAALAASAKAVHMAAQIEGAMRRVSAALPVGSTGLDTLRTELEAISKATGRSQEELAQAAQLIARTGAESATAVSQRLAAAVQTAEASGTDISAVIEGLDQVLDLFGKSSEDAAESLATLFAAARGHASLESLFASLQAAAPTIATLGLDIDTAARALAALDGQGRNAKQAAARLKELAEQGETGRRAILELAAAVPKATAPLRDLEAAAKEAGDGLDRLTAKTQAHLDAAQIAFGRAVANNRAVQLFQEGIAIALENNAGGFEDMQRTADRAAVATVASLGRILDRLNGDDLDRFRDAMQRVQEAVRKNRLEIAQLSSVEIQGLADAFRNFDAQQPPWLQKAGQQVHDFSEMLRGLAGQVRSVQSAGTAPAAAAPGPSRDVMGEIARSFDALISKTKSGKVSLAAFDKTIATLKNRFAKELPEATATQELAFQELEERAGKLRGGLERAASAAQDAADKYEQASKTVRGFLDEDSRKLVESMREIARAKSDAVAELAETMGDKLAVLDRQIREKMAQFPTASKEDLAIILAPLLAAKKAALDLNGALARIDIPPDVQEKLAGPLGQVRKELEELRKQLERSPLSQEEIQKAIDRKELELVSDVLRKMGWPEDAIARTLGGFQDTHAAVNQLSDALIALGDAMLAVLSALGAVDQKTASIARGAIGIGKGLKDFFTGNKGQGAAETLGGVADLIGGFLTGQREERKQRERTENANLEALRKIERNTRGGIRVTESRSETANIKAAVEALLAGTGAAGGHRKLEGEAAVFEKFGLSVQQIIDIAAEGGITLDGTKQSYQALLDWLKKLTPEVFALGEFTDALELFNTQLELGAITTQQRLEGLIAQFKKSFGESFAGLDLSTIDFSSGDAFQASIQGIIDSFDDDGVLTDAEKALAAALRELGGAFAAANTALADFQNSLAIFNQALEIFGGTADEQLQKIVDFFTKAFPDALAGITSGSSIADVQQRLEDFFTQASADGTIDESEQAIIDAFQAILAAMREAADEAQTEGERARDAILQAAETTIEVEGITDPLEQFKIRMAAIAEAFPELADVLGQFDIATQEGRDALEAWIASIVESPEALEALADSMGLSVDELLDALLGLSRGAREAKTEVETLAQKLTEAFGDIDLDARIFGETLTDTLKKKLGELGISGLDLSTDEGRAKAIAALRDLARANPDDDALRGLIADLIASLESLDESVSDATPGAGELAGGATSASTSGAANITERQANLLADLTRTELAVLREIERHTRSLDALLPSLATSAVPRLQPPALLPGSPNVAAAARAGSGSSSLTLTVNGGITLELPKNFTGGPAEAGILQSRAFMRQLAKEISRIQGEELGIARRLQGRQIT